MTRPSCTWGVDDTTCRFRASYLVTSDRENPVCGKHLTALLQRELSRKDVPNVLVATP